MNPFPDIPLKSVIAVAIGAIAAMILYPKMEANLFAQREAYRLFEQEGIN